MKVRIIAANAAGEAAPGVVETTVPLAVVASAHWSLSLLTSSAGAAGRETVFDCPEKFTKGCDCSADDSGDGVAVTVCP